MPRFLKLWVIVVGVLVGMGCRGTPDTSEPPTGTVQQAGIVGPSTQPMNLTATAGNGTVTLNWSEPTDTAQTGYIFWRSTTSGSEASIATSSSLSNTTFVDSTVTNGQIYYYKVKSTGPDGTSAFSNEASATPNPPCCSNVANGATTASATTGSYGSSVTYYFKFTADPATLAASDTVTFTLACTSGVNSCGGQTTVNLGNSAIAVDPTVTNGYVASVFTSTFPVGTYQPTAATNFTTSANNVTVVGSSYTVTQAATAASLAVTTPAAATTSTYGQSVTLTATVSPVNSNGAQPGTVQFYDGVNGGASAVIGTPVSILSGASTATYTSTALAVGTHSFTAIYTPTSSNYAASPASSPAVPLAVSKAATTTSTLTSSSSPQYLTNDLVGNAVTFTVNVNAVSPSTVAPTTGTVHFIFGDGTSTTVDPSVNASSQATTTHTYTAASTGAGYVVTAQYMGDGTSYNASPTPPAAGTASLNQVIVIDGTTLALTSANGSVAYGSDNTFTAKVSSSTANNADNFSTTSTVDFFYDNGAGPVAIATGCPVGNTQSVTANIKSVTATSTDVNCTNVGAHTPVSSLPGLATGSYTITATYNDDAGHAVANGTLTGGFSITRQSPVITASSLQNPSTFGQAVTLKAVVTQNTASSGPLAPTGTVTFVDSTTTTTLGTTTTLVGTSASSTVSATSPTQTYALTTANLVTLYALAAGHVITATYTPAAADYNYATKTTDGTAGNANITQVVNKSTTTTVEITSSNPGVVGVPVTFTINVAAVAPGVDLNGNSLSSSVTTAVPVTTTPTVTLMDGTTALGTATFGTNETWTYTTSALTVGDHTITATYNPNNNFTTSTSSIPQHIDATGTPASIVSSQNPSLYGAAVTFTATLVATSGGVPTGTVTFKDGFGTGLSDLATVALTSANGNAIATYTTSSLTGGLHGIGFVYNGDTNHVAGSNASLAQTISRAPTTTTLAVSPNPAVAGQTLTLSATVTSTAPGAPSGNIIFEDEGAVLATVPVSGGAAVATFTGITAGTHSITANYQGDTNFDVSTGTISETVSKAPTTLTLSSSSNPSVPSSNVTFTAVVASTGTVTGSVVFTDGAQTLGSATIGAGGIATLRTAALGEGPHAIHATYAETANYAASDATLTEVISSSAATIAVTSSPNPSTFGQTVTIVAAVGAATGVPSGSVTFGSLGTATIDAQGNATLSTSALSIGTTTITASYSGDGFYPAGTGSTAQVVNKGATTVALVASANPALTGASVTFTATVSSAAQGFTGSVDFLDGTVTIGSGTLNGASATFTTSTLAAGTHAITAQYKGDVNFDSSASVSLSETVNAPSTSTGTTTNSDGGTSSPAADAGVTKVVTVGSGSGGCAETPSSSSGSFATLALAALGIVAARRRRR